MVKSGHEPSVVSVIGAGVTPTIPAPRTLSLHSLTPAGQPVVFVLKPVSNSLPLFNVPSVFRHAPNGNQ